MQNLFKKLNQPYWQNLLLFALLLFYIFHVAVALIFGNLFNTLGSDFLGFWTTGYIANHYGYNQIYDQSLVSTIQKPYHEKIETDNIYAPILSAFPPAFALPFQALATIKAEYAFMLWSLLNLVAVFLYLRFFLRTTTQQPVAIKTIVLLLLSYAMFHNLFWGQVNIWLLICFGEYIRMEKAEKNIKGGLWLAGILIKPQALILIIPIFIFKRKWKQVIGFSLGFIFIFCLSYILAGWSGLQKMIEVWLGFASGIATNAPEHMVNWRAIASQFDLLSYPLLGFFFMGIGIIITLIILIQYVYKYTSTQTKFSLPALLLIMVSTALITWHSHIHMMLIFLPLLAYFLSTNQLPQKILYVWLNLPLAILCLTLLLTILGGYGYLPNYNYEGIIFAWWGIILNLLILQWLTDQKNPLD